MIEGARRLLEARGRVAEATRDLARVDGDAAGAAGDGDVGGGDADVVREGGEEFLGGAEVIAHGRDVPLEADAAGDPHDGVAAGPPELALEDLEPERQDGRHDDGEAADDDVGENVHAATPVAGQTRTAHECARMMTEMPPIECLPSQMRRRRSPPIGADRPGRAPLARFPLPRRSAGNICSEFIICYLQRKLTCMSAEEILL